MAAEIVLDHYLKKHNTLANTLTDIDFSNLPFLQEKEAVYNMKGQKVLKSYYDLKGKEAIRITYDRIIGDHQYLGNTFPGIFLGLQKTVNYIDWAGNIAYSKKKQLYSFDLKPIFLGDGNETVIGFSSQKQRQILKSERFSADDYLQAMSPKLYALLYEAYREHYTYYLRTGIKDCLVDAVDAETNPDILAVLNLPVYGWEPMTVKELVMMNLQ